MTKNSQRGFTLIEILVALAIVVGGAFLAMQIFDRIALFSKKSSDREKLINLESRLLSAIQNPASYVLHKSDLKVANQVDIDFFINLDGTSTRIAELRSSPTKLYFNEGLVDCGTPSNKDCKFYVELSWSTAPAMSILSKVGSLEENSSIALSERTYNIPQSFFDEQKKVACPNDGKFYLGIKSFDSTGITPTTCWSFDKTQRCADNTYPIGLKAKDPLSDELVLDCKSFSDFSCPAGYAPLKAYPLNAPALQNACVNIKMKNIPLRLGHIKDQIIKNTPPVHASHYGLKWTSAKLCPSGYSVQLKVGKSGTFENDFAAVFDIYDADKKTDFPPAPPCGVKPICGKNAENYYCDNCPISDPSRMAGCSASSGHNFSTASGIVDSTCKDPRILAINSTGLSNFTDNYECRLDSAIEFVDGEP